MSDLRATAARLRHRLQGRVELDAELGPMTTFRVGGRADVLVEAESVDDLLGVAEEMGDGVEIAVVGRGSNLLVSDEGFAGVAVKLGRGFRTLEQTEQGLRLGGAVHLPAAARLTARLGLAGFEFAAEIPGSFGGAVRMNAGAHGRSMGDVLAWADTVDVADGVRKRLEPTELDYAYRHSSLQAHQVVVEGEVSLTPEDPKVVAERIASYLSWRREAQPGGLSAGSVFKNPPGDAAGRLIDVAGGKGMRVGGAEVSSVHANFIVVSGGATANDVWTLIGRVRELVSDRMGIDLEPEVRLLGSFPQAKGQRSLEGR